MNSEFTLYVANDFLNAPSTALDACTDSPAVMPSDVGTCDLSSKQFSTAYSSALECWDACWEYYGQKTWCVTVLVFLSYAYFYFIFFDVCL